MSTVSADAATPASGSVSDTAPTTTWSAGPFAVPNVSGTAGGDVTCGDAQLCDDFALRVSVPSGYDAGHSLRIDIKWPNAPADFDLYVLEVDGREIAASASSSDPETVLLPAVTASYTVRVVPYAPLGESFTGTASLVTNPVDPPPSTATPATYASSFAPDGIADAHNAGEPSIGVDRATGAVMFQAYTSTLKVTYDTAGTATWQDNSASAANGCPQGSLTSLDPILFTDPATHRTFESQLAGKTALTCYTDDDGVTWTPTSGSGINSGVDHQTIGGGPFASGGPGALTSYPNAVYYCSQDIADASCAVARLRRTAMTRAAHPSARSMPQRRSAADFGMPTTSPSGIGQKAKASLTVLANTLTPLHPLVPHHQGPERSCERSGAWTQYRRARGEPRVRSRPGAG